MNNDIAGLSMTVFRMFHQTFHEVFGFDLASAHRVNHGEQRESCNHTNTYVLTSCNYFSCAFDSATRVFFITREKDGLLH